MVIPVFDPPPGADVRAHWVAEARRVAVAAAELARAPRASVAPVAPTSARKHPTRPETAEVVLPVPDEPVEDFDEDDGERPWFAPDGTWVDA